MRFPAKTRIFWLSLGVVALFSVWIAHDEPEWRVLWPSIAALAVVFASRSALIGLLVGALVGAFLLADGSVSRGLIYLLENQFSPIFGSSWKLSAILFTLILGGFVALVEAGGGLQSLVRHLLGSGRAPAQRMQLTVIGFGLLVFFDGLANTMLIGRLLRSAADRCGVSRVKLAYLADTTGSAVACLAFVSTWIVFQLAMIREGFAAVGQEVSAYALFFKSLPTNFYCWFALAMALVSVLRDYNPGAMGAYERRARKHAAAVSEEAATMGSKSSHWLLAIVPILVLTLSIPVLTYWLGAESLWPFSFAKFADAYGAAEGIVPQILVAASVLASIVAGFACTTGSVQESASGGRIFSIFIAGVRELLGPVAILLAAWMLGGAISELGAAEWIADLLNGRLAAELLPVAIFAVGAVISFSTGTSWGTMGVLMPLAIPVIFTVTGASADAERDRLIVAAIGAVFSGAVFGDHCSPFSDTTIVAAIASGVEPLDHVRTQLPFAVMTAVVAMVCGFIPLGYGLSPWLCLILGVGCLFIFPYLSPKNYADTDRR
jgi:Na+/H+ antiporter NhaC